MQDAWETPADEWAFALCDHAPTTVIWDPFYCNGRSGIYIEDLGFDIIEGEPCSDYLRNITKEDRCECMSKQPPEDVDLIATNPPFSRLDIAVPWLLSHRLPIVMLLPTSYVTGAFTLLIDSTWLVETSHPRKIGFIADGRQFPPAPFTCTWVECYPKHKLKRSHTELELK